MDPLKKHHADNFNIKPYEGDDTEIRRNFVHQKLLSLINYIKNALKSIAYTVSPKSNPTYISHMHGEDIAIEGPTDYGNEVVNQEMLKFSDNVHKFWENNSPKEVVDFFMKSAVKNSSDIYLAMKGARIIKEGVIPGITQDEIDTFSNIYARLAHLDRPGHTITFRDIKTFYNVFVKYMNYAIKNDPRNAAKVADLEKLFFGDVDMIRKVQYGKDFRIHGRQVKELFDKSKVSHSDRDFLKSDNDFVMLLQRVAPFLQKFEKYESGHESNTFHNLVGNILRDNKNHPMNYSDLKRLKRSADIVGNIIEKRNNGELTQARYYCDLLYEASRLGIGLGLAGGAKLRHALMTLRNNRELSEDEFEEIFATIIRRDLFGGIMESIMPVMESLPDIVNKALSSIDLDTQLKHTIKINILDENY